MARRLMAAIHDRLNHTQTEPDIEVQLHPDAEEILDEHRIAVDVQADSLELTPEQRELFRDRYGAPCSPVPPPRLHRRTIHADQTETEEFVNLEQPPRRRFEVRNYSELLCESNAEKFVQISLELRGFLLIHERVPPCYGDLEAKMQHAYQLLGLAGSIDYSHDSKGNTATTEQKEQAYLANLAHAKDLYHKLQKLGMQGVESYKDIKYEKRRVQRLNQETFIKSEDPEAPEHVEREVPCDGVLFQKHHPTNRVPFIRGIDTNYEKVTRNVRYFDEDTNTIERKPIGVGFDNLFAGTHTTIFTKVERITNFIKPITFLNMINQMMRTENHIERLGIMIGFFEAHGLYWQSATCSIQTVAALVIEGIDGLSGCVAEFKDLKLKKDKTEVLEDQANDSILESFFSSIGEKLPAGSEKIAPIIKIVAPLLFIGLQSLGMTKSGAKVTKVISTIAKGCKDSQTIFSSMDDVHSSVSTAMKMTFDRESLHMKEAFVEQIRVCTSQVDAFDLKIEQQQIRILDDPSEWNDIQETFKSICDIYDSFALCKENIAQMTTLYITLQKKYVDVKKRYDLLKATSTVRQEPVCLWLYGEPGVGKSHFASYIVQCLSKLEGRKLSVYTRNATDQYCSGYAGQDVFIYDDFASSNDGNDIKEFVNMKSSASYSLNMAGLEEKGRKFVSRYIIVCTNISGINSTEHLQTPDCIDRRRDLLILVKDDTAVAERAAGHARPVSDYDPQFGHLELYRFNPIKRVNEANYIAWRNPRITPHRLVYEMKVYEGGYKAAYEVYLSRELEPVGDIDFDEIELDDDTTPIGPDIANLQINRPVHVGRPQRVQQPHQPNRRPPMQFRRQEQNAWLQFANREQEHYEYEANYTTYAKSFLIMGPPGLGKTCFLTALRDSGCTLDFIDEFTDSSKAADAMKRVWDAYEDRMCEPVVLVCNETNLTKEFFIEVKKDRTAFFRRCIIFRFDTAIMAKWKTHANSALDYDRDIVYTRTEIENTQTSKKKTSIVEMINEINGEKREKSVRCDVRTQLDVYDRQLPDDIFNMMCSQKELKKMGLMGIMSRYVNGDFEEIANFDIATKFQIIKILKEFRSLVNTDLPEALVMANAKKVKTDLKISVLIHFTDADYVFETTSGVCEFFIILDTPVLEHITNRAMVIKKERATDMTGKQIIMEVVDGIFYVFKLALGLGCSIQSLVNTHQKTHPDRHDWCGKNEQVWESWGSDMDEEDPMPDYVKPKRVAKSTRSVTRAMDYCKTCHSSSCEHCFALVTESNEERVRKRDPTLERLASLLPPLQDERKSGAQRRAAQAARNAGSRKDQTEITSFKPTAIAPASLYTTGGGLVTSVGDGAPRMSQIPIHFADTQLNQSVQQEVPLVAEAMTDPAASDVMRMAAANTVFIGTPESLKARGLMIAGRLGVTNSHTVGNLDVGEIFDLFTQSGERYKAKVLICETKRDIVVFSIVDKQSPQFRSIVRHIARRIDSKERAGHTGWVCITHPDRTTHVTNIVFDDCKTVDVAGAERYGQRYHGHATGVSYQHASINTKKGDCGSVVMLTDPTRVRKIIALHAAASQRTGIGALIYAEEIEELIASAETYQQQAITEDIRILKHQKIAPIEPHVHGEYLIVGVPYDDSTSQIIKQYQSTKTRYWKSPLAKEETEFEPVVLDCRDPRPEVDGFMPYENGMEKFNHRQADMDEQLLNKAVDDVGDYLATVIRNEDVRVRVLTKTEAVNGVSWIGSSNPIQRDTSAGYPWKHFGSVDAKKEAYLEFDQTKQIWVLRKDEKGQMLNLAVDQLIECARHGIRTASVNCGTLKDEPRKLKRIYKEPGTRIFWGAPVDKVLADRMYFHAAVAALSETHERHPIKIGINPLGQGFHLLYNWHSRVSNVGFDIDMTNFDSTVPLTVMEKVPRVWNKIYRINDPNWKPEDDIIRNTLHKSVQRPLVLYRDCVAVLPGGNPSGQPMTGSDNSIVHFIYDYYVWMRRCEIEHEPKMANFDQFMRHVASSFYGDDGMSTVALGAQHIFNPRGYIEVCAEFGVVCTPADKTDAKSVKFRKLHELEFLKRNFKKATLPNGKESHYWCGALLESSFDKMLSLVLTNKPHDFWREPDAVRFDTCTIVGTLDMALIEAVNHGIDFWEEMRNHLMKCCVDAGIKHQKWLSYTACFNIVWGTDLSEDSQATYEIERFKFESMSQPAVVGDGETPMHTHGPGEGPATPMAPIEQKTESLSRFITSGTGAPGMLPRELYDKDIAVASIAWSSTQNAGTIIYDQPISPRGANAYVQYFAAPYNAWTGGLVWTFTIAGTGFNGGKLGCCRMPPNYNISNAHTLADMTVFPYDIIDVKEATSVSKKGVDEKNILFHWRNEVLGSTEATGGTFVVFVLAPLISSNGGVTAVNIVIFNRPDESFRVAQLMPLPSLTDGPPTLAAFQEFFPPEPHVVLSPYNDQPITEIVTYSASATPVLTMGMYGQVQGDGTNFGRAYAPWFGAPLAVGNPLQTPPTTTITTWGTTTPDISRPVTLFTHGNPASRLINTAANTWTSPITNQNNITQNTTLNMSSAALMYPTLIADGAAQSSPCYVDLDVNVQMTVIPDPNFTQTITPSLNESFVMFRSQPGSYPNGLGNVDSTQTSAQIDALTSGNAKGSLIPGQAILFTVIDKVTNLPIGYLKFNYPGYFTTSPQTTVIIGPYWQNLYLPTEFIDMTTQIPTSTQIIQNSLLVGSARRPTIPRPALVDEVTRKVYEMMQQQGITYSTRGRQDLAAAPRPGSASNRQ